ncbi:MAG: hypothetical protein QOF42_356 [Gammaproteobacteria bacterium]|nr:hypothetical protein [Gammaproteobacteria bacterium]
MSTARRVQMPIAATGLIWVTVLILSGGARAATSFNAQSAMGINLATVNYYSSEQPFINSFVTSEKWITHSNATWDTNEEKYVNLDASGWPITLNTINEPTTQQFNSLGVLFLLGMPNTVNGIYPAGQYIVLYDGEGTLSYGFDAALVRRTPGRDVINVTPSNKGIDLRIVATDPRHTGNYLRNIKVVTAANEAAAKAGQILNPAFLNLIQNFRALRFMDWFLTNNSTLSSWTDRPIPTNAFFGTSKGVPIEIAVQLANAVSADAWMNVPVMADDNFISQMATLVHSQLGGSQKIYVELSNEVWNSSFSQSKYAVDRGKALWPTRSSSRGDFEYNREWFGMRTAQMCDIWRSVWRSDPRLVCVLGAQAAWSFSATEALKCPYWTQGAPCSGHAIDAVAVAPYMGGAVPAAWTSQPDGGLVKLFQSLYSQNDSSMDDESYFSRIFRRWSRSETMIPAGGFIAQDAAWEKDFMTNLAPYKLPLLAYEGGQNFADGSTNALNTLYMAANRDLRMGQAYTAYFQLWKAGGGQLFMHYSDVGVESKYGSWGAVESIMQTTTPLSGAPPKWQAIQTFISRNPCWWASCSGTIGTGQSSTVSAVPTNLHGK